MSNLLQVLKVTTSATVRWRINRYTPLILNVKLGQYTLVNPIHSLEFETRPKGDENRNYSYVLLPSNDEVVFSSNKIVLAVPQNANLEKDLDSLSQDIARFLIWLRSLSFQEQIPSTPDVVVISYASIDPYKTPNSQELPNITTGFTRKFEVESCATEFVVEEAAKKATADERVPVHHHLLIDAFAAFRSRNYRECFLYAAIAAESLAANYLEQMYISRLDGENVPELRTIEIPVAGGTKVRKDPIYEALSKKTEFSMLLHERPLYLIGKSLLLEHPETYNNARMLYSTRNKIVHRGELSEGNATQCFSLTSRDARVALDCVADIFRWFGEPPVVYPDSSFVPIMLSYAAGHDIG